jgi:ubiquinone/menaquinone biosynthesis C-methylase UbiE
MSSRSHKYGIKVAPFEQLASRYDAWFDGERGRRIFPVEVACLRGLLAGVPRPWLEVGVGTGRFAAALGIEDGIDPSNAVLELARHRGVKVKRGVAEKLPCDDQSYGAVFMIVTVCFLAEPVQAFAECARVLKPGGSLIIGLVPKDSPWGKSYATKGREGHPFYSVTTFYTCQDVIDMAGAHGFALTEASSCLSERPDTEARQLQPPRSGIVGGAGFVGMRFSLSSISDSAGISERSE